MTIERIGEQRLVLCQADTCFYEDELEPSERIHRTLGLRDSRHDYTKYQVRVTPLEK
jgi:hypothetical protein